MATQKAKMESHHWIMLYTASISFDVMGWIAAIIDLVTLGLCAFLLNLFVIFIFSLWALIWKDRLGGFQLIANLAVVGLIGESLYIIPYLSEIVTMLPKWTAIIARVHRSYGKSALGLVAGKAAGKINTATNKLAGSMTEKIGEGMTSKIAERSVRVLGGGAEQMVKSAAY